MPLIIKRNIGEHTFITVPPSTEPTVIDVEFHCHDAGGIKLRFDAPEQVEIRREEAQHDRSGRRRFYAREGR